MNTTITGQARGQKPTRPRAGTILEVVGPTAYVELDTNPGLRRGPFPISFPHEPEPEAGQRVAVTQLDTGEAIISSRWPA